MTARPESTQAGALALAYLEALREHGVQIGEPFALAIGEGDNASESEALDSLRAIIAERDVLRAALERIAAQTCDHGPQAVCPREEASEALRACGGGK